MAVGTISDFRGKSIHQLESEPVSESVPPLFSFSELQELSRKFETYFPNLAYIIECRKPFDRSEVPILRERFRQFFPHLAKYFD